MPTVLRPISWPRVAFLVGSLVGAMPATGAEAPRPADEGPAVSVSAAAAPRPRVLARIDVRGLARTQEAVVLREMRLRVGERLDPELVEEGLQRLRNLQVFDSVRGVYLDDSEAGVALVIDVVERWTILPFVRATGGGGTTSIIAGLYDINVTGRYVELGAQYENLSGAHSGVVWFRQPRLFGRYLRVGGDVWLTLRNRDLFTFDGEMTGAFSLRRNRVHLFGDGELHRLVAAGARADLLWDELSERKLSPERRALNRASGFVPEGLTRQVFLGAFLRLGRLDFDGFLVRGAEVRLELDRAQPQWGAEDAFWRATITSAAFWLLPWRSNLGFQLRLGHTGSALPQYQNYLGGFDSIRGFADGQFRGNSFWHANVEARVPSARTRWLILQHVAFADAGRTGDQARRLFFGQEGRTAASVGTGLRLISPRVYRLSIRLDLAYAVNPRTGLAFAFGTQQFF